MEPRAHGFYQTQERHKAALRQPRERGVRQVEIVSRGGDKNKSHDLPLDCFKNTDESSKSVLRPDETNKYLGERTSSVSEFIVSNNKSLFTVEAER